MKDDGYKELFSHLAGGSKRRRQASLRASAGSAWIDMPTSEGYWWRSWVGEPQIVCVSFERGRFCVERRGGAWESDPIEPGEASWSGPLAPPPFPTIKPGARRKGYEAGGKGHAER